MPENRPPAFYDFEASSLAGVPIEVGWAYAGDAGAIVSASCLIKPPPEWCIDDGWDEAAEELHGISRATLTKEGRPPFEVCRTMNMAVAGRELYADSSFDPHWLRQLFDAAGLEPSFTPRTLLAPIFVKQEAERLDINQTGFEQRTQQAEIISPRSHRAEADARYLATLYQLLCISGGQQAR